MSARPTRTDAARKLLAQRQAENGQAPEPEPVEPVEPATGRRYRITWANTIAPKQVVWAWIGDLEDAAEDSEAPTFETWDVQDLDWHLRGRLAAGTLALAAGPEGVGKSSFGVMLAAMVSNGTLPGAWYGTPQNVLYATVEDSWECTVVPRLIAAGADLKRVGRVDVVTEADELLTISLPADNDALRAAITAHHVALIVLDPLLSMISERLDSHRERDVRMALDPLARIADDTRAAILGIAHFNKGNGVDIAARITGSGAFEKRPPRLFGFARDDDSGDYVMTQAKNSLGRCDLPSISYRMEPVMVPISEGVVTYAGRWTRIGIADRTVVDILASATVRPASDTGDDGLTPAQRFIRRYLADNTDNADYEVPAADVIKAGDAVGYTERDLIKARAKKSTRVATRKGGTETGWYWRLTDMPDSPDAP